MSRAKIAARRDDVAQLLTVAERLRRVGRGVEALRGALLRSEIIERAEPITVRLSQTAGETMAWLYSVHDDGPFRKSNIVERVSDGLISTRFWCVELEWPGPRHRTSFGGSEDALRARIADLTVALRDVTRWRACVQTLAPELTEVIASMDRARDVLDGNGPLQQPQPDVKMAGADRHQPRTEPTATD